ncbi:hypothetical protein [Marinospirillum perlucidum]|uniref:hypothetical protein n=1 Tax=Marinospirillum perlucidum TaxID=1982602 RepID=UPI000DF272AA|nr:hypothetical protein [Marinospirillum perlucidum]
MFEFMARPWLLLLAPLIYSLIKLAFERWRPVSWESWLAPGLAERLLAGSQTSNPRPRLDTWLVAALVTVLLSLYLAGIGYSLPMDELQRQRQEVVIIQQLSPPEPGQTASLELLEEGQQLLVPFLNARKQGQTALIFYAGSAHLASPMTRDARNLRQLLSLAHPSVMPLAGNRPDLAFKLASETGQLGASTAGAAAPLYWIWITRQLPSQVELLTLMNPKPQAAELLIIAPDQDPEKAAVLNQISYVTLLTPAQARSYLIRLNRPEGVADLDEATDQRLFQELGHGLLLPALLLLLWQYLGQPWPSRNKTSAILLLVGLGSNLLLTTPAQAFDWQGDDYLAWKAVQEGRAEAALELTDLAYLKAQAWFQMGDYARAAQAYQQALENPPENSRDRLDLMFNAGTALLFAGEFQASLDLLQEVLQQDAEREKACINAYLAEQLLQGRPLPASPQEAAAGCQGGEDSSSSGESEEQQEEENRDASSATEQQNQATANSWKPRYQQNCDNCLPLNEAQQQTLDQLEEDPWQLLRNRFRDELQEQQR